ncbi:ribonuclease H [Senna tora]|uniref:Ribonuclease H n=1 Tax=Senna tora TaxID=362788 RepID=A0A834SJP6_9FABA|nr:ribonuclease H [Senna tora]
MNTDFLYKLAWSLLTKKENLWVDVISKKYNFDGHNSERRRAKPTDSRLWKELMKIWPEFIKNIKWTVGNGTIIKFWKDHWIEGIKSINEYVNMEAAGLTGDEKLCEFTDESGEWQMTEQMGILPIEVIGKIKGRKPAMYGSLYGRLKPNKETNCCFGGWDMRNFQPEIELLSGQNLILRALDVERREEFAGIPWPIIFPIVCHCIWEWRNKENKDKEFRVPEVPHRVILNMAKIHVAAWATEGQKCTEQSRSTFEKWLKPPRGWGKVNVDGAMCQANKMAGCGGLLRGCNGKWISGFMAMLGQCPIIGAELWAIYHGLNMAWDKGFRKVELESDSRVAINRVNSVKALDSFLHPVVQSIRELLKRDWEVKIKHIPRQINRCADRLAKQSLGTPLRLTRFDTLPEVVKLDFQIDERCDSGSSDPGG